MSQQVDYLELEALLEQFRALSDVSEGGISLDVFKQCLGPLGQQKNLIVERAFNFFDKDKNGVISFEEMAIGCGVLCKGTFEERSTGTLCMSSKR